MSFQISFHTDDFQPGLRSFFARGELSEGTNLGSIVIPRTLLSSDQAWQKKGRLILPLLFLVLGLTAAGTLLPFLLNRKIQFHPGVYGPVAWCCLSPMDCRFPDLYWHQIYWLGSWFAVRTAENFPSGPLPVGSSWTRQKSAPGYGERELSISKGRKRICVI